MNYLAHLHLGGERPTQLLGSLYGDFVKGSLAGRYEPELEAAILLHRHIDTFTDSHPFVLQALARFEPGLRRYAGIIVDVFFDHCLARDWSQWSEEPLAEFTARVYRVLLEQPELPGRLQRIAPMMAADDWLGSYADFGVMEQVLRGISRRLSRPEGMAGAFEALRRLYTPLSDDFAAFYPVLQAFAVERRAQAATGSASGTESGASST